MKHFSKTEDGNVHLTIGVNRKPIETVETRETFTIDTYDYVGDILDEETRMEDVWGNRPARGQHQPSYGPDLRRGRGTRGRTRDRDRRHRTA